jgi:hypothetical protein
LVFVMLTACAQRKAEPLPSIPPVPDTGHATVSGQVLDGSNLPVPGVLVACNESNDSSASYVTGADGVYAVQVPANAAITLSTTKLLYAMTVTPPMQLQADQVVSGFNLLMLPSTEISSFNAEAGPDEVRGVLAIQVVSMGGQCNVAGATVAVLNPASLQPMPGAKALYTRPGTTEPDRSIPSMQSGTYPNAYLVGVPEGQNDPVQLNQPGCTPLPFPVTYNGVQWLDGLRVVAKGLTPVQVFVP